MRRYKKDERSSEWHHRNEDSSKDDWWSAVDIRTRGSVEGLVWHQNCCGFSCKTDGELFLVRCQLGGDNNGFYFRELIEDAEDAAETAKGGARKELGERGAGSRGQRSC